MPTRDGSTRTREAGITRHQTKTRGTHYRLRLSGVDGLTGEPVTIDRLYPTFAAARDGKRAIAHELAAGRYHAPSTTPLAEVLTHWLESAHLAANSRTQYAGIIRRMLNPAIGEIALGRLTGYQVQTLYTSLRGSSYAGQIQGILNGALNLAVREQLVASNVAAGLTIPAGDEPATAEEAPLWTPAELATFLADRASHWSGPLFWVAAYTGLRLRELTTLRWEQVAEAPAAITVRRAKSRAGERTIALDRETAAVLRRQRADQARRRDLLEAAWCECGAVFDRGDGRPVSGRSVEDVMQRAVIRLGLPPATPHSLRAYHASALARAGVPPTVVQKRLGHASFATTAKYYIRHTTDEDREAAEAVAPKEAPNPIVSALSVAGEGGEFPRRDAGF